MTITCRSVEPLLSGYLDDRLTQQQAQQVSLHVESCESCRQLLDNRRGQSFDTSSPNDGSASGKQMPNGSNEEVKGVQLIGWILLVVGYGFVSLLLTYEFIIDNSASVWSKLLSGSIVLGGALLFVSVLRQRLAEMKNDKYNKVKL